MITVTVGGLGMRLVVNLETQIILKVNSHLL